MVSASLEGLERREKQKVCRTGTNVWSDLFITRETLSLWLKHCAMEVRKKDGLEYATDTLHYLVWYNEACENCAPSSQIQNL